LRIQLRPIVYAFNEFICLRIHIVYAFTCLRIAFS
jgi:hypothetical protein